ncbi:hypothetical protein LCGC14_1665310 [marine sediment metagenome]|uniref:HD domain-containing protein n=1 Tax=marine sediment metagenome TaxID=412755 RepID=A0A0F9HTJ7_9ZZZZ
MTTISQMMKKATKSNPLIDVGIDLLKRIEDLGYEAYIVGGSVRDIVLGNLKPHDIDLATNMPIQEIEKVFKTYNVGKSKDFGIVVIRHKEFDFEISNFRQDGKYSDGRRPDDVEIVGDFKQDVTRRDFTINALGLNSDGAIIDHVDGIIDIQKRLVRAVGDPYKRFQEDHLRMIRAARFAAPEDFSLEKKTREAIIILADLINKVTPERIRMELVKAAEKPGPQFARFVLILDDLTLLEKILPEVACLKNYKHNPEHHPEGPTVMDHTIKCLEISDDPYLSKLAILFHDIGKSVTMKERDGQPTYHRHELKSAEMTKEICERLKFSLDNSGILVDAIADHMKFHKILEMRPSKIARLVNSNHFDTLVDVARADEHCRGEKFAYFSQFPDKIERAEEIKLRWEGRLTQKSNKLVSGNRIMEIVGIKPGPTVGKIKRQVEDHIIDNELDPTDDKLMYELILRAFTMGGL